MAFGERCKGSTDELATFNIQKVPPAFDNELAANEEMDRLIEVDKFTLDDRLENAFFRDSVAVR